MKQSRPYVKCAITPKGEQSILRGHPWVYDTEIQGMEGEPDNGSLVDAVSSKGRDLGTAFYKPQSKIP